HRVADDSVNSDRAQQHGEESENAQQAGGNARRPERLGKDLADRPDIGQRQVGIQFLHPAAKRAQHRPRLRTGAEKHSRCRAGVLQQRKVHVGRWIFTDGVVFRIASHADHLHPFVSAEKLEALADWVLLGPEALGCALIDHRNLWAVLTDRAVKAAATQNGNAHGLQVVRGNAVHLGKHAVAVQDGIAALQKYAASKTSIHQRYAAGKRGFLHAWSRLHHLEYTT